MLSKILPLEHSQKVVRGFTIVELLVTLAIFTILTVVVLANYPSFNNKIALEILAQNIALSIREAQVYGISIRATDITETELAPAYGAHFWGGTTDLRDILHNGRRQYMLFSDSNTNKRYDGQREGYSYDCESDPSSVNECVQVYTITGQSEIGIICSDLLIDSAESDPVQRLENFRTKLNECKNDPILEADVTFKRPNPEAYLTAITQRNRRIIDGASELDIFVRSTGGTIGDRMVVVWNTGQISVQACDTRSNSPDYGKCNAR